MKGAWFLFALLTAAASLAGAADGTIAIVGGRVLTVSGAPLENATVVIEKGKIAAVGANLAPPAGATIVDAKGKTVYPGLIDALSDMGLTEIGSVPGSVDTNEVGDVNPHAKAWVALQPHSDLIPVARANGVTAVLVAPDGGLISGQSALIRLAGSTPDALTVKQPVAMHIRYPSGEREFNIDNLFDEPQLRTLEERVKEKKKNQKAALDRLRNLLDEAKAYGSASASRKPDLPMEALAPVALGKLPVIIAADEEDDIRGAVAFAVERGFKPVIAGGLEAWRCVDLLKQKDAAVLLAVDRVPGHYGDPYDSVYATPAALQKAGVPFAIVNATAAFTRNLPYEAAMARAYGLAADAALRAITLSPAEILGVAARMGSIEPGKDANLFLATGDIMDHRTEVTAVYIDGVAQSLETRHTRLYKEFKDR